MSDKNEIRASDIAPAEWYRKAAEEKDVIQGYNPKSSNSRDDAKPVFRPIPAAPVSLHDTVETERKKFHQSYRKIKLINYVIIGLIIVFVVATIAVSLVSNAQKAPWGNYVIWPLFAITVMLFVVSIVFSSVNRKRSNLKVADYLDTWTGLLSSSAYSPIEGMSDVAYSVSAKVKDADLINTHYWSVINTVDSRNRVVGKFEGKDFSETEVIVECPPYSSFAKDIEEAKATSAAAGIVPSEMEPSYWYKKVEGDGGHSSAGLFKTEQKRAASRVPTIGAFGKFISVDLSSDGDTLIVVRKSAETYQPTHVTGLIYAPEIAEQIGEDFLVWTSSREFARRVLSASVIENLQLVQTNDVVIDWFLSFTPHGLSFMLNLSDDVMELPFNSTPADSKFGVYFSAVKRCFAVVDDLNKRF